MAPHAINFMTGEVTPDHGLPAAPEGNYQEKPKRRRKAVVLLLILLILGGWWFYKKASPAVDTIRGRVTLEPKKPKSFLSKLSYIAFSHDDNGVDLAGAKTDRINILLLGMGGAGHDGPFLTDTIMIASIKPSTKQISLISIPRDLDVYIPGYGYQKINHANAYGELKQTDWGGAFATELISKNFNIDIPYYIRLDFKAFEEIIDEVGGVTVHVDKTFTDPMFPADNDEYQTVSFQAGDETMGGTKALTFTRSRHGNNGEGSDFARARRQQKILLALKEKLGSIGVIANPIRAGQIMSSLESHLTTNMEFSELVSLARLAKTLDTSHMTSLVFDSNPGGYLRSAFTPGGAWILEPKSGSFNEMNQAIANIFNPTSSSTITTTKEVAPGTQTITQPQSGVAHVEIQNATWNAGLAARVRRRLENKNVVVETIGNAAERPIPKSGIYKINPHAPDEVVNIISDELQIPLASSIPSSTKSATSTDILVLLGDDFVD